MVGHFPVRLDGAARSGKPQIQKRLELKLVDLRINVDGEFNFINVSHDNNLIANNLAILAVIDDCNLKFKSCC